MTIASATYTQRVDVGRRPPPPNNFFTAARVVTVVVVVVSAVKKYGKPLYDAGKAAWHACPAGACFGL
jgi:hypothetical protein